MDSHQLRFCVHLSVDVRGKDAEPFPKEMGLPDRVKWSMWPK
jgi:hypothetical protein